MIDEDNSLSRLINTVFFCPIKIVTLLDIFPLKKEGLFAVLKTCVI